MYRNWGKRLFDLVLTVPSLILLLPLLAIAALLVRLDSPGPIFFVQDRLGRNGRIFSIYKFRTMTDRPRTPNSEIIGRNLEVTRVGYWLRRFKIDELLQLLNVVKGEMSLVGPRPGLPMQLSEYSKIGYKRLTVLPGLTGLAQIRGNIYISWQERWQYDAEYVECLSLKLDLWIIIRTIAVVLFGERKFIKHPDVSIKRSGRSENERR